MIYFKCLCVSALFVAGNLTCIHAAKLVERTDSSWIKVMLAASLLMVAGIWGQFLAVQFYGAMRATAIIDSLLTVTTLAVAYLLFSEILSAQQWMGIGIILVGMYLTK
jgi:drug/metabolite transporter (DMT)-like permease